MLIPADVQSDRGASSLTVYLLVVAVMFSAFGLAGLAAGAALLGKGLLAAGGALICIAIGLSIAGDSARR